MSHAIPYVYIEYLPFAARCDMYLHVVEPKTQTIAPIPHVLKVIDAKYDFLKHYYAGFAIENVVVSLVTRSKSRYKILYTVRKVYSTKSV